MREAELVFTKGKTQNLNLFADAILSNKQASLFWFTLFRSFLLICQLTKLTLIIRLSQHSAFYTVRGATVYFPNVSNNVQNRRLILKSNECLNLKIFLILCNQVNFIKSSNFSNHLHTFNSTPLTTTNSNDHYQPIRWLLFWPLMPALPFSPKISASCKRRLFCILARFARLINFSIY